MAERIFKVASTDTQQSNNDSNNNNNKKNHIMDYYYARVLLEKIVNNQKQQTARKLATETTTTTTTAISTQSSNEQIAEYILKSDSESLVIAALLQQLPYEKMKGVFLIASSQYRELFKLWLSELDPLIVDIITTKMEDSTQTDDTQLQDAIFGLFPDQRYLVNEWLDKKEAYGRNIFKGLLSTLFGWQA